MTNVDDDTSHLIPSLHRQVTLLEAPRPGAWKLTSWTPLSFPTLALFDHPFAGL